MTKNSDFKALVRQHMDATGLTYTAARAELMQQRRAEHAAAWRAHRKAIRPFLHDGHLVDLPARRKPRTHVLLELVRCFEPGRRYTEPDVNDILAGIGADHAYVRREMVEHGYLCRSEGLYWLTETLPERLSPNEQQETPAWEAIWLPLYLAGDDETLLADLADG